MTVYDAWLATKRELVGQHQGDCGVFSFWYATVLLRHIDPTDRAPVYAKTRHMPPEQQAQARKLKKEKGDATYAGESIRHYAKKSQIKSGQGELLTATEIQQVIAKFGYKSEACASPGRHIRGQFIVRSLTQNRPVLFAYTKGRIGPVDAKVAMSNPISYGTAGGDFGSHWSLIIKIDGNAYVYVDPHYPDREQRFSRADVLASNEHVDSQKYVRYWGKPNSGQTLDSIGSTDPGPKPVGFKKVYDIGKTGLGGTPRDQKLNNVLIAVF